MTDIATDRAPVAEWPPLSLYIHLPWCERKCPYCDFNSFAVRGQLPEHDYVEALLRDLNADRALTANRVVDSVFIGGGTPSLFSAPAIGRLLTGLRERVPLAAGAEITLEANPGSVEAQRFADYRNAGVNRLSIGVQSFRNHQLNALGRVHDGDDACHAFAVARGAGFDRINLDLMYALPGDDVDGSLADLRQAIALGPEHLSWYQLTLEPHTAFHRRPPPLPDDPVVDLIETRGRALLQAAGYERYEISAYARAGQRCTHNLNYWTFGDYLGIGAGAHGKRTRADGRGIIRRSKRRSPHGYVLTAGTAASVSEVQIPPGPELVLEYLMNTLRLADGFAEAAFARHTGMSLDAFAAAVDEAGRRGWLQRQRGHVSVTADGHRWLNRLLSLFADDESGHRACR